MAAGEKKSGEIKRQSFQEKFADYENNIILRNLDKFYLRFVAFVKEELGIDSAAFMTERKPPFAFQDADVEGDRRRYNYKLLSREFGPEAEFLKVLGADEATDGDKKPSASSNPITQSLLAS